MKEIELDLFELQSAAHLGILRCLESIKHKEKWGYNYKGSLMQKFSHSISGACAEAAVAKYLNIKFPYTCNHGNQPDLIYKDKKLQIRSQTTKVKNQNSLIITPNSKKDEFYIFVQDEAPKFIIKGFINSTVILQNKKYLTDFGLARPPCYSIPIDQLTPVFLLKDGGWN